MKPFENITARATAVRKYYVLTNRKVRLRLLDDRGYGHDFELGKGTLKGLDGLHDVKIALGPSAQRVKKVCLDVKEEFGVTIAKQLRFVSALKRSGFKLSSGRNVDVDSILRGLGVDIKREQRTVNIKDARGEYSFTDDYYWTGLRWLLKDFLKVTGLNYYFLNAREDSSVSKLNKTTESNLVWLQNLFEGGGYLKTSYARFWGGKNMQAIRPLDLEVKPIKYAKGGAYRTLESNRIVMEGLVNVNLLRRAVERLLFNNVTRDLKARMGRWTDLKTFHKFKRDFAYRWSEVQRKNLRTFVDIMMVAGEPSTYRSKDLISLVGKLVTIYRAEIDEMRFNDGSAIG